MMTETKRGNAKGHICPGGVFFCCKSSIDASVMHREIFDASVMHRGKTNGLTRASVQHIHTTRSFKRPYAVEERLKPNRFQLKSFQPRALDIEFNHFNRFD
jgi:hypothetical protein